MNERILELADQAAEDMAGLNIPDEFCKKFAELIVQECCDIVLAPHNETGFTISMDLCKFSTRQAIDRAAQSGGLKVHTQGISKEIKQHFGVEE
jgi:hypothetical protein